VDQHGQIRQTWATAYWHGRELVRAQRLLVGNFYDVETDEEYWVSGPRRDRGDARYGHGRLTVDEDVREVYEAFLNGCHLPGRENG
jgi:hypothetical protein